MTSLKAALPWLLALAFVTIPMGESGRQGLSDLSKLTITEGSYEMYSPSKAIVRAKGRDPAGIIWKVLVLWVDGHPASDIITFDPETPL